MAKRFFTLAFAALMAIGAWADDVTTRTLWTFTTSIGEGFGVDSEHAASLNGTFERTGFTWTAEKILTADKNKEWGFNHGVAGRLYIVYGATGSTDGQFLVKQQKTGESTFTTICDSVLMGRKYTGPLGAPNHAAAADGEYTQVQAVATLDGTGTVIVSGTQPYCIYAMLFVPDPLVRIHESKDSVVYQTTAGLTDGMTLKYILPQETASKTRTYTSGHLRLTNNGNFVYWTVDADGMTESEHISVAISNISKRPSASFKEVDTDGHSVYTITYAANNTLYYTLPGGTEQTVASGDNRFTHDVTVTQMGKLKVYEKNGAVTSDTLTTSVFIPLISVEADGTYDFAKLKEQDMPSDLTIAFTKETVTVGDQELRKPNDLSNGVFNGRFMFNYGSDWRLLSTGRLRAVKSANDKYMSITIDDDMVGKFFGITYTSGNPALMAEYDESGTAELAFGTTTLQHKQFYRLTKAGQLLIKVSADTDNHCDISKIQILDEEATANEFYVSPTGNDENAGTKWATPFKTLKKALEQAKPNAVIHILPGTYQVTEAEYMDETTSSTWNIVYNLSENGVQLVGERQEDGKRPVFDFTTLTVKDNKRITAFYLTGKNITVKNIETIGLKVPTTEINTQSENFRLNGAENCLLKNIAAHHGQGVGFYVTGASKYNTIEDCDAYENMDVTNRYNSTTGLYAGENNDGFGCHVTTDCPGNVFRRCRAWLNADDGFDFIKCYSVATLDSCVAWKNGYATYPDGNIKSSGNGNGMKAGGYGKQIITLPDGGAPMHVVKNSIAAENKGGFYANHHLGGLQFEGNRAFKNGVDYRMTNRSLESAGTNLSQAADDDEKDDNTAAMNVDGYGHILINNLSYGTSVNNVIKEIDASKCTVVGNSFTYQAGTWTNEEHADADFESVDVSILNAARDAEGNLPVGFYNFLQLKNMVDRPATPTIEKTAEELGKVTYSITYPADAELHCIMPSGEEQTITSGEESEGKKTTSLDVTTSGVLKIYAQKNGRPSAIVMVDVVVPMPVTYNFVQLYKDNANFDFGMGDETKTTRYFSQKNDDGTMKDTNGNFYDFTTSPFKGVISWREKQVKLTANGLQPANENRPFAITGLKEGDVIRIEFKGNIYYAKHSTRGDELEGLTPGDAIASAVAYTVSKVDETYGYVMFFPTKATTISQISINEPLTSTTPNTPVITAPETENSDGTKTYTVTFHKGEVLHYTAPDKDGEQTVNYADTTDGVCEIIVSKSGALTCWTTLEGGTEKSTETKVLVTFAADEPTEKITVHTIGDSTMSSYDQNIPAQKGMDGWGSYLGDCLKSDWATVYNWADRGEGAKSYYNGIWLKTSTDRPEFGEPVMNKVKAGDYVIIQFGHNDSKAYDTKTYEEWMGKLVDAVKEKGATPIIASSICRRRFEKDGTISLLGQINSIEDTKGRVPSTPVTGDDHEYDYPYHAKMVAQAKGIEFIDVTAGTKALYESYGDEKSAAFFPYGEKTHTNKLGAQTIAKVVAQILFENETSLKKYVDLTKLELPDADTIEVVKIIDNFKDEATVTGKRIWTFNNFEAGTVIANEVTNINGMYARGHEEAVINAVDASPVTTVTFSDDNETSVTISRAAKVAANGSSANSIGMNTAGRTDASALRNTFAFNIATPGTFYAIMAPQEEAAGKKMRLLFSGVEKDVKTVNEVYANDNHLCELSYHAETTGVIYLCAGANSYLYAAMFVPDMEKGTEEDWNYQMVLTRDAGLWTYTNMSGSNQSVPEGLSVYAVSAIDSEGKATLADIGQVIPQGQGFLVKGKANTEYALPATTDEATYQGVNLLVGNTTLRFLPATEDGNTNYWFDGTKFVKATGNETIHEKQAYLSAGVAVDEVLLDMPDPVVENAVVTLKDDSRKDRKVYQAVFGQNQKFYYLRPGQDTEPRSQSYKAEFAENPFTVTVSNNGDFIYWTKETIDKVEYESEHNTIVVNTIARKPTATYSKVIDGESVYQLAFTKGTSLYYKIGDGAEQAVASGDTVSVRVAKTGMLTAYSKNSHVVSDTLSTKVYAPTPSIVKDNVYDFTLLKDSIGADYTLTSLGYEGTVTVGETTLNKPNALTATTLDIFAFSAPTSGGTESTDWRLLNAGRLRAAKSDNDKYMAILGVRKGQYLTMTYSGASIRYSTKGTASMVEGTDTLKSKQCYEITGDGDLLLTIPADSLLNCDITVISLSSDETVTEPRFTAVEGRADQVKLTPGTSSFGKKVKAYYTTDGSIPTTESTMIEKSTTITADSTCVVKAYSVSETGKASAVVSYSLVVSEVDVENAVVTLKDDSRKDRKVYQVEFKENQKLYYLRPGQDSVARAQSYKAEYAETPFTVTVSYNGNFIYWLQETINGRIYESRHDTIVVNSIAKKPTATLDRVEGEVAYYTVTFTEGTTLHYTLQDGQEAVVATGSAAEVPVAVSYQMKAWSENENVVSDVLTVTLFAPTPPPSEDGEVDFSEASEDLPSDLEVTLDMEQAVRVDGEILYKPSALTAATFNDRFAFSELTTSKKITITTKHQLTFAKGDDVKMAILGLSAGDIVAFDFTGSIQISDPTMLKLGQPNNSAPMRAADTAEEMMISEASYEVVRDGDVLLNVLLADESMKISRMYIAAKPSLSAPATIQFSEAAEEYEALEYGNVVNVYYKGKSSAQEFCRVTNNQGSLPISGKLSVEAAAGEIVTNGLRTNGSRIAVHNVARGDVIMVHYQTGAVTYAGHDEKGCRVRIGDHVLEAGDTIHSGDIVVVNQVDYLNNYVVLRLDSKAIVSGLFINSEGVESISIPTIVDKGKNTIQITGGKSSTGMNVTTIYTTDGTEPTEKNGTSADGCYETFEVKLLQGGMVTIKAVTVSETGITSPVATLIVNADHLVYGPSFLMDENGNMYDVYNAWGQKVNALRRGQLYIVNGKKIVY